MGGVSRKVYEELIVSLAVCSEILSCAEVYRNEFQPCYSGEVVRIVMIKDSRLRLIERFC